MSTDIDEVRQQQRRFNNSLMADWDRAMDGFFTAADKQKNLLGFSDSDVYDALDTGCGYEVADGWKDWVNES